MNLRMYPVPSNSSRRLRRSVVPAACTALDDRLHTKTVDSKPVAMPAIPQLHANLPADRSASFNQNEGEILLRQQALDKAQQGKLTEAINLFTQLIDHNPNSASNFNNRGLLHSQMGHFLHALVDYNQALRLNPKLAKVYNNRANCYAALGDLEAAVADYETAIDFDPTDIRARFNLGVTLRQAEQYDQAIENFDLALQVCQFLNTTDIVGVPTTLEGAAYAERGRTFQLLGDWNFAVADYYRALARLPLGSEPKSFHRLRAQTRRWLSDLLSPLKVE